ncbi:MAG TPA: copper chaperone [Arcobacter sp.]|nr:copper chaperone [Arcobacter sp.]HIP56152.1 copper chaperone [Arcobacter sp.]
MKRTLEVINVKCGGCAGTLKKALLEEFGEVEVNLDINPRQITLEVSDEDMDKLSLKLKSLGYPLSSENLNTIEKITTTAKSFVSCAVGKMDA